MNKYPAWLNFLVLIILILGCILALPNIYGSVPAIQIANKNSVALNETQLEEYSSFLNQINIEPESLYLKDGRIVMRFDSGTDLGPISEALNNRFNQSSNIAQTLAPKLPTWMRELGLGPMSLGLDLRGGVYVLLEVDTKSAIDTRMEIYQNSLIDSF